MKIKALIMILICIAGLGCLEGNGSFDTHAEVQEYEEEGMINVGDVVTFGSYAGEDIEWIVLDASGNSTLLLARSILDFAPYNEMRTDTSWEEYSLRQWLNGTFFNQAFTVDEQSCIVPAFRERTEDSVFLLTLDEFNTYLANDPVRKTTATAYAAAKYGVKDITKDYDWYWLQTSGAEGCRALMIYDSGNTWDMGLFVDDADGGVRPAIRVNMG